jgi:L-lysine exporter family protein LysE/ArgO
MVISSAAAGLAFGLSLIVAVGAQNTYVLQQGLLKSRVRTVVVICSASDVVLIAAGVAGASVALDGRPWLLRTVKIVGACFLFGYAALAARRTLRPAAAGGSPATATSFAAVVGICLALTWLNPGVYLDTLVLLGSVANSRGGNPWWFGAGAAIGSVLWFVALGFGARLLSPLFTRPGAWRILDVCVAVIMTLTGLRVLLS